MGVATAEQLKSLIKAGFSDDRERLFTSALQVAAHEAGSGHGELAHDIRAIVDRARREQGAAVIQFPRDMQGLVLAEEPELGKATLVMRTEQLGRIDRIVSEREQVHKLRDFGLSNRRKVLLVGPPGTGKTLTAKVLAHELRLPLYTIQVDRLVTKFMGETTAKLRQVFDLIQDQPGVYLFDEFDAIAGERSMDNDVGEMRRVLNAFLQFIEQDQSESLIVAASNNPDLLDRALFRRFDDVLYYAEPNEAERRQLIGNVLGHFAPSRLGWTRLVKDADGLSHADIDRACRDAIKHAVLQDRRKVSTDDVHTTLLDRRRANSGRRA
jgi:SpoVK/Ycf46/Vps4 family AAA+-type ATPase